MQTLPIRDTSRYPLATEQRRRIIGFLSDHGALSIILRLHTLNSMSDIQRWDIIMELYVRAVDNLTPSFED